MNLQSILKKHGIVPNPDADQHFMVDNAALKSIVDAAQIMPDDIVLEIGAGIGNLTVLLAKKAKVVYAIEKDAALIGALKQELSGFSNVEIIEGDALKAEFPGFDKLVSNLPYQICEALLQRLISADFQSPKAIENPRDIQKDFHDFKSAVICVPKTFAETVCANNGKKGFSRLSFVAQAFFDAEIICEVTQESFYPKPRTNSALLGLSLKKRLGSADFFIQELLRQPDKKLKNALREAIIFAGKNTGGKACTKRAAKALVSGWDIPQHTLEKEVAEASCGELEMLMKLYLERMADSALFQKYKYSTCK